jgi:hypothetical protein
MQEEDLYSSLPHYENFFVSEIEESLASALELSFEVIPQVQRLALNFDDLAETEFLNSLEMSVYSIKADSASDAELMLEVYSFTHFVCEECGDSECACKN